VIFGAGETVTRTRRTDSGTKDAYGNTVWTTATADIPGCGFDPGMSQELMTGDRDVTTTYPALYMPADTDVKPNDQITVRGKAYEVDGYANNYVSPFTGWRAGVVVKLKNWSG
jgi:hypothetical protein